MWLTKGTHTITRNVKILINKNKARIDGLPQKKLMVFASKT
jgi:hypothetical protein